MFKSKKLIFGIIVLFTLILLFSMLNWTTYLKIDQYLGTNFFCSNCSEFKKNDSAKLDNNTKKEEPTPTLRYHTVVQELTNKMQSDIKEYLGNPDVEGILSRCMHKSCRFFIYFDKIRDDNNNVRHLVILTKASYGEADNDPFGEIIDILSAENQDKVFTIFKDTDCWAANDYIIVDRKNISSNGKDFILRE